MKSHTFTRSIHFVKLRLGRIAICCWRMATLIALLINFSSQRNAPAQEIKKFVPEPIEFSDRFDADTRKNYKLQGNVQWSMLKLTIPPSGLLAWVKTIEAQWTAEFELWPAEVKPGQQSVTRFGFPLSTNCELLAVVSREKRNGQLLRQVLIALVDYGTGDPQPYVEQVAVSPVFTVAGDVERWKLRYRHGVLEIQSDGQLVVRGCSRALSAWTNAVTISQLSGSVDVTRVDVRGRTVGYSAEQRKVFEQTVQLRAKAEAALAARNFKLAVQTEQQRIPLMKQAFGEEEVGIALAYEWLADVADDMQRYAGVKKMCVEAAKAYAASVGLEHPETLRTHVHEAYAIAKLGDLEGGEKLARQYATKYFQLAGTNSTRAQHVMTHLADILQSQALRALEAGRYADSQRYYGEVAELVAAVEGPDIEYVRHLRQRQELVGAILAAEPTRQKELADFAVRVIKAANWNKNDQDAFIAEMSQILADSRRLLGDEHHYTVEALVSVAIAEFNKGEFGPAILKLEEAAATYRKTQGENSSAFAVMEAELAAAYSQLQRYEEAGPLFEHAMQVQVDQKQQESSVYARLLLEHGRHLSRIGEDERAHDLLTKCVALYDKLGEIQSANAVVAMERLASLARGKGDLATSQRLNERQQELLLASGDRGSAYAMTLSAEAADLFVAERYDAAIAKFRQALDVAAKATGTRGRGYQTILEKVLEVYAFQGNAEGVSKTFGQLLEFARMRRESLFDAYTLEQQFQQSASDRDWLNRLMALATHGHMPPDVAYEHLLSIKGAVTIHQRRTHLASVNPQLSELFRKRQRADSAIMAGLNQPLSSENAQRLKKLVNERNELDRQLSRASAAYRAAVEPLTVGRLQKLLPEGAVIVDYVEYDRSPSWLETLFSDEPRQMLAAFVVSKSGNVALVQLGSAAVAKEAVLTWISAIEAEAQNLGPAFNPRLEQQADEIGRAVGKMIWDRLPQQVDQATSVIVSPDTALTLCPFAALPLADGKSYLIEKQAICHVPAAGLLPDMWSERPQKHAANFLLVSRINYDEAKGLAPRLVARQGTTNAGSLYFAELPPAASGTSKIRSAFIRRYPQGKAGELQNAKANEQIVRQNISQATFVYLDTHGFCMPISGLLALRNPDRVIEPQAGEPMVSGVALAGANRALATDDRGDGILWADEIASLDLSRAELVTLSACQTAVGHAVAGEGLQGPQRALAVAGAKTSLTSLWSVDAYATSAMMDQFHEGMWTRELGKSAALQQAMIYMLRKYRWANPSIAPATKGHRCPPFLWSAWVLYGDGR